MGDALRIIGFESMTPSGACFESGPRGYFSFDAGYSPRERVKLLAVFNDFYRHLTVFDEANRAWSVKEIRSGYTRTWWLVALVHTVFNPWVKVEIVWEAPRTYKLEELKKRYLDAIEEDDDILTQFVEADDLKRRVTAAESFDDLVRTYRWMETDSG